RLKNENITNYEREVYCFFISINFRGSFFRIAWLSPNNFCSFFTFIFPLLAKLRIQGGFLTSIVVLLHIYALEKANVAVFLNELYIILIGMGIALLVNSIMPNLQPKIDAHKKHIESKFGTILYEYAAKLR